MKKILLLTLVIAPMIARAQQVPISENYFLDKYSLAPSYAGNFNQRFLMLGYRSDWTGIDGGPKTMRLSFNDYLGSIQNVGLGGKVIFDKASIFNQLYVLSSYSYKVKINAENTLLFGLSAGVYRNGINLTDYYNDPEYDLDPSLISRDIKSKLKFMSDFSAVWIWKDLEAGFMFSNITFGDASYKEVNLKYNPLANYQIHTGYNYRINEILALSPLLILRGGKYIKSQFEAALKGSYNEMLHLSFAYRDPGILGFGAGVKLEKGFVLGYNFNLSTNVALGAFNNHEVTLGLNFFELAGKTR